MTEKFKTKYHALAWAAEDEKNVFVDGEGDCVKFDNGEVVCAPQWNDYRVLENVDQIIEPCHKLEVEKSNEDVADNITIACWGRDKTKVSTISKIIEGILDECDNRYARKK